jgi:ACS family tartrate transporter-like MFS transporter
MGFSNAGTGFVVASCFVAPIPVMIVCGRSSSKRGERIWHVALPWLLTASCLAVASLTQSDAIVLAALVIGLAANFAAFGAFFSLPSTFLRGAAAAGGLGLFCTVGNFGGFFGPAITGILVQGSGNYRSGFAADAIGFALAALIVVAVGRALTPRATITQPAI